MSANIPIRKVSFLSFMIETRRLSSSLREEVKHFVRLNKNQICGYEFGRIPGHRIYRISLKDGSYKDWNVFKRYY